VYFQRRKEEEGREKKERSPILQFSPFEEEKGGEETAF